MHARVSYMAFWQDGGGRPIASANYGAAGTAPATPLALPVSSATVLVNQTAYNNRAEAYLATDPAGMVTRTDTDDAGRTVRTIQNYAGQASESLPSPCIQGEGSEYLPSPGTPGEGQGVRAVGVGLIAASTSPSSPPTRPTTTCAR
jgi:hypothetical protein